MKVFTLDTSTLRPLLLKHKSDSSILFKGARENFTFGLQLETYNIFEDLADRKTNYNTSYFLSTLYSLSSIIELDTPYTFRSDASFTTYLNNGSYYIKAAEASIETASGIEVVQLSADTSFSTDDRDYFFTVNLSTSKLCYITREIDNNTYYLYTSGDNAYLGSLDYSLLSSGENHLFEYSISDNTIKLLPNQVYNNAFKQLVLDGNTVTLTAAEYNSSSIFNIIRNRITYSKGPFNNTLTYYISSYNKDSVGLNLDTTSQNISNNYFGFFSNYTINHCDRTTSFDLFPLKNQSTLEEYYIPVNHFNSQPSYLNRVYEKIYSGSNQNTGNDKIQLGYNIGTYDTHFKPSLLTYFTTPSSLSPYTKLNINDSKLESIGAIPGNNPLVSDKVYKRRIDFKDNNFSDDINATYLCTWLSGNEDGDRLWVDRYYNPDAIDFENAVSGTAFYNTVTSASAQSTYVFDINSRLTFETNNDYAYYHLGSKDYERHIESLSSFNLSRDLEILTSKGVPATYSKIKKDIVIDLDGNRFGKFRTDHRGDMSLSFWLSSNDYSRPLGYEIVGNYFEEGFGIFNTDFVTPNIYIPFGNKLVLLNNDLDIYDEIELFEGNNPVNIKGVARKDNFSEMYILGENNVIYIYNSNPNLTSKITDLSGLSNLKIDDFEPTKDRIYTSFNPVSSKGYFYFDISNNSTYLKYTASAETVGDKSKLFVDPNNNSITFLSADNNIGTGNELAVTNDQNPFTIRKRAPRQTNIPYNLIYKGSYIDNNTNTILVTGGNVESIITNVFVDDEDFVITLHDNNKISKLKNTREALFTKELDFLSTSSTKYIDLTLDFEGRDYVKYYLIVEVFSNKTYLHKLDKDFNLITTKNFGSRVASGLGLTKSITGFYYLKKYKASKNRFKVILKTKPNFTNTGVFPKKEVIIDYDISTLNTGYNHFAVNLNSKKGWMELWVNGYRYKRVTFSPGTYALDNPLGSGIFLGALSTPYNLTFSSRLLQPGKYFLRDAKIKGFRMYNRVLDFYEIRSHINYHNQDKDCIWSLPIGQRSYVDTIDRISKFSIPEKLSNVYDIEIENFGINSDVLKTKLKNQIRNEITKVTPYYDTLNEIRIDESTNTSSECTPIYNSVLYTSNSSLSATSDPSNSIDDSINPIIDNLMEFSVSPSTSQNTSIYESSIYESDVPVADDSNIEEEPEEFNIFATSNTIDSSKYQIISSIQSYAPTVTSEAASAEPVYSITIDTTPTFTDEDMDTYADVGETITYTISVVNTGDTTLTNVVVTDPVVTIDGGPISLDAGVTDTSSFSGSYTIVQSAIDAEILSSTMTVSSDELASDTINHSQSLTAEPVSAPLDDLDNIWSARSLRLLRSDYSGPVVQAMRDSDNTLSTFGVDELSSTSLSTWGGAGNIHIQTHYDQGPNGYNWTQTTSSNQPIIYESGVMLENNNEYVMKFVANTGQLSCTATSGFPASASIILSGRLEILSGWLTRVMQYASSDGSYVGYGRDGFVVDAFQGAGSNIDVYINGVLKDWTGSNDNSYDDVKDAGTCVIRFDNVDLSSWTDLNYGNFNTIPPLTWFHEEVILTDSTSAAYVESVMMDHLGL